MISSIAGWRWKAWPLPAGIVTRTSISRSAAVRPARDSHSCGPQGEGSTTASAAVTNRNGSCVDMAGGRNHSSRAFRLDFDDHEVVPSVIVRDGCGRDLAAGVL